MTPLTVTFLDGQVFPVLGLGTYQSEPGEVFEAVKYAIDVGYRHIDCSPFYGNEKEIGQAIREKINDGTITRDDIRITSKLWNNDHREALVEPALLSILQDLQLDYLDLFLIHWPFGFKEGPTMWPVNADGKLELSDIDYLETWRGMEAVHAKGLAKSIGVSNFNTFQMERLLQKCKIVPATNQIECHPYLTQSKMDDLCLQHGIIITAYSPLGAPGRSSKLDDSTIPLAENQTLLDIANTHNKSVAQVMLRYQIQKGHIAIPKSTNKSRIEENFKIWDFELTTDQMEAIDALNCYCRLVPVEPAKDHQYYPFNEE